MSRQSSAHAPSDRRLDLYGRARRVLRQVHLWIALVLCLPLVMLGVTGSILVFRSELGNLLAPPPRLSAATDKPHTVAEIIAAMQARIDKEFTPFLYEAPNAPGQPATLRFIALGGARKGSHVIDVLVDPASLDFVTWHYDAFPGFLSVIVRLHGNLLMAGRVYVGWLGVALLVLGFSGLILWWPGRNKPRVVLDLRASPELEGRMRPTYAT